MKSRLELYIPVAYRRSLLHLRAQVFADDAGISLSEFIWRTVEEKVSMLESEEKVGASEDPFH